MDGGLGVDRDNDTTSNETSFSNEEELWSEDDDIESHDRDEPAAWKDLPDEVTIEAEEPFSEVEKTSLQRRIESPQTFVKEGQSTEVLSKLVPGFSITTTSIQNYCRTLQKHQRSRDPGLMSVYL
ncbi:hypothetical protein ACMFMG_003258 [Clarireedia jacksonii]